jgi:endo-1,4-beta-xylanase
MNNISITFCFIFSVTLFAQIDPCTQNTKLSNGTLLPMDPIKTNEGRGNLSGSPYYYEIWVNDVGAQGAKLTWYGTNQGGGAAFKAEWNKPDNYIGRVGYRWGDYQSDGGKYTQYKNIYADFNYERSGNGTGGDYSYIGIYGWSRNPDAEKDEEKLIEYYIVDDWFGNEQLSTCTFGWNEEANSCTPNLAVSKGNFTVDGGTYNIYTVVRTNKPSIDGYTTFTQYFSIRQGMAVNRRQCGTYSVTEHFKKWEELGMELGNMFEATFFVETGGGPGSLDIMYLKLSQEDERRLSSPIKALNNIPKFRVRSLSNGNLFIENPESSVIYLYSTGGKMLKKISVPAGSSTVKLSVPSGIYVVRDFKANQMQMVMVKQ